MATSDITSELKQCSKCGCLKPHTNQYFRVRDGFTERKCRECLNAHRNAQRRTPETRLQNRVDAEGYKVCGGCGERKPHTTEFFHQREGGLTSRCKVCRNAHYRSYSHGRQDQNAYNARVWRAKNVERNLRNQRNWSAKNREARRASVQGYKERHRDRVLLQRRVNEARRRARKQSLPDTLTVADWQHALDYFNGCCAVCGRQLNDLFSTHTAAADHWIPLNDPACPGTVPTNIVPLCHGSDGCNNRKRFSSPDQWVLENYSAREAHRILKRIKDYFDSLNVS